jgi:hypothetical protein
MGLSIAILRDITGNILRLMKMGNGILKEIETYERSNSRKEL